LLTSFDMDDYEARRYESLVELGEVSCRRFADRPLFGTKRHGRWEWTSYAQFHRLVDALRGGLSSLGVEQGDRVAIVSNNRVEWAVAAYATYGLGAIFVPMYEAQHSDELSFILRDCGAKVVFAANETLHSALTDMQAELPALKHIVTLDAASSDALSYENLLARGRLAPVPAEHPDSGAIAGFVYTSGTTGMPKGVTLSHANLTSNVAAVTSVFPLSPEDQTLSFLPWAHVFGQVCELHILLTTGGSTAINDELPRLVENLSEVKPTILVAVPRIFNKIHAGVKAQIAERPAFVRALFRAGLASARKRHAGEPLGPLESVGLALAERLIFSKVRARFGGRLKYAISGSAALDREVAEFIDALGIEVYEGYGLTETSPVVAMNRPGARQIGSVGRMIPGVRITIDRSVSPEPDSGEVVVYGPNVMKGYHNRPEENEKVFTPDGGLRTGDLGRIDARGYLYITGRIKEQYKLENGKYVMPSPLEEALKLSPYVSNVMLFGDNRPYNVVVVVPERQAVEAWAKDGGLDLPADLAHSEALRALLQQELERASSRFRGFERPRDFILAREEFTTENGLLTPTLKLKRAKVLEVYRAELEALYEKPIPSRTTAFARL
jgi:long-chain acyl-CoA synthetase